MFDRRAGNTRCRATLQRGRDSGYVASIHGQPLEALASSCAENPRSLQAGGHVHRRGKDSGYVASIRGPAAGSTGQLLRGESALASGQWPLFIKGGRIPAMSPRSTASRWKRWPAPARRIRARFRSVATSIKEGRIPAMSPRSGGQPLGKGERFRLLAGAGGVVSRPRKCDKVLIRLH